VSLTPLDLQTLLFTDIEGSTRLWEDAPEQMRRALSCHDRLVRAAVERHAGILVKTTGDGVYAAFDRASHAIAAAVDMQLALADPAATGGVAVRIRCGMHRGPVERRDNDLFGNAANRAARIMGVAHGGQVLASHAVAEDAAGALPEGASLRDLGAVRLKDLASAERVFQVVHPGMRQQFPALRSLEATPNNLPRQLSSFVGRERETAEATRLLRTTRLLTLTGVGGLGKTRLSLQLGADVLDDFPDGVWFVELAPIVDARFVAQATATVLGVKEEAGRGAIDALARFARARRFLVILDNCEHVAPGAAEVVRALLAAGPGAKVLASSREPLRIAGETTYALPPLATPAVDAGFSLLARNDAVRLFAERGASARPGFAIGELNAPAVARICRRLDGIPLAIELAAARVRTMSVDAIEARLSDRFRLLTGGDASALPRQQTLRGCIEWSHDLLSPPERALMRRIAVFAGDFPLQSAEQVLADDHLEEAEVAGLLAQLVEKSLAEYDAAADRYRQLETVRQFAAERLAASGEEEALRARHFDVHAAFAESAINRLTGPEQKAWMARLGRERENMLAAHAWCGRAAGRERAAMILVLPMLVVCSLDGTLELGFQVATEALARPGAGVDDLQRCRLLLQACQLAYLYGRYVEARAWGEEGLAIAVALAEQRRVVTALRLLGQVGLAQGDRPFARRHLEQSVAVAREVGDGYQLSAAGCSLADLLRSEGSLDAAEALYEEMLALCRARGDRVSEAALLLNEAFVSIGRGAHVQARVRLAASLSMMREFGLANFAAAAIAATAALAAAVGDFEVCMRLEGACVAYRERTGCHLEPVDEAFLRPFVARARASLDAEAAARAEAQGRALGYEGVLVEAGEWLAGARVDEG